MKIQRPNQTYLNLYNKQMEKQLQKQENANKKDQIQISKAAKQLQHDIKINENRRESVEAIKNKIDAGHYELDIEKTAEKMIQFWSRRS